MGDTKPREADTAPDTGHGRQMMGDRRPREADTAHDTWRTHLKIELSTPTVNCLGKSNNNDVEVEDHGEIHCKKVAMISISLGLVGLGLTEILKFGKEAMCRSFKCVSSLYCTAK